MLDPGRGSPGKVVDLSFRRESEECRVVLVPNEARF